MKKKTLETTIRNTMVSLAGLHNYLIISMVFWLGLSKVASCQQKSSIL